MIRAICRNSAHPARQRVSRYIRRTGSIAGGPWVMWTPLPAVAVCALLPAIFHRLSSDQKRVVQQPLNTPHMFIPPQRRLQFIV